MKYDKPKPEIINADWRAFTETVTRSGIPLSYVAEKIHHGLCAIHFVLRNEHKSMMASEAFEKLLISFLAINNMLSIGDEKGIQEKLLAMDDKAFLKWINYVEEEGSLI